MTPMLAPRATLLGSVPLLLLLAAAAPSRDASDDVHAAVERSLPWLAEHGQAWIDEHGCVSCHQIPFLLWSMNAAEERGFEVDERLADWNRWSLENPGGDVDTFGQLLLAGSARFADDPAAVRTDLVARIAGKRNEEGGWSAGGQLTYQRRPNAETDAVTTLWTHLALSAVDAPLERTPISGPDVEPVTNEKVVVELLYARSTGQMEIADAWLEELLERQNEDGGWAWLDGEESDAFGTGQALYALAYENQPQAKERARAFLVETQLADGSWNVRTTLEHHEGFLHTSCYWGTAWAVIALLATEPASPGEHDWPQWRGPDRDGVSKETRWSAEGTTLWSRRVGLGYSCPSVAAGRVYVQGHDAESGTDTLYCFDERTGGELWTHSRPAEIYANEHTGGTLSTPTVAGDRVYMTTRVGELYCFDARTGEVHWKFDAADEAGTNPGRYGFAGSPLVQDGLVIVNVGRVLALDAETAKLRWRTKLMGAMYSTPAPFELGGMPRLAVLTEQALKVLDFTCGAELYETPWNKGGRGVNAATPVVVGDRIFISTAYERGGSLFAFDGDEVQQIWHTRRMRNKMAGCVLVGGHLFGFDESMLKCIDLEGEERWRKRGLGNGSVVAAGDRLILTSSRGELIVAEATSEEFRELSRAKLFEEGTFWSPPVIANGRIYVRSSLGELICRDHRASAPIAAAAPVAPEGNLPEASALFAGHLTAIGGEDALRKHTSMRLTGTFEMRAVGFKPVEFEIQRMAPNRVWRRFQAPTGMPGHITRVFDGEVAYELNAFYGNKLSTDEVRREYRETSDFYAAATYAERYRSMKTHGQVELAGRPCWRVDAVTAEGTERSVYFSVETGLLVGRDGPTESIAIFDDYKPFDGVLLPTLEKYFVQDTGIEETWRIETVELDAVDETVFDLPEKIRELLEKEPED